MRPLQAPPRLKFLPKGRPSSRFCPCFLDVDGSGAAGGSMIRHAPQAALCPVDPLPVAVIELSLRAVLVFPVGNPHLLASHPASAPLSAVDLPPVAASADVKPHSATRPSAKQLDPCHFAGHTPHDSMAACEPCRVGGAPGRSGAIRRSGAGGGVEPGAERPPRPGGVSGGPGRGIGDGPKGGARGRDERSRAGRAGRLCRAGGSVGAGDRRA